MSSSKSSPSKTSIIISKFKASIEEEPPIGNIQSIMSSDEQYLFMHILDCMGALSCTRADQKAKNVNDKGDEELRSKYGVFWRTVREIAEQEALLEDNQAKTMETSTPIPKNGPFGFDLNSFPEDSKLSDGLPLDFAISLPNISLADIETLFTAHSVAVQACRDQSNVVNPCHLAAMTRLEVIQQLQNYFPHIGVSLASESYTPLHLAASYSNSVAMVRKLAELHPAALGAKNSNGDTPLHLAARYSNIVAVRVLAELYPAALDANNSNGDTPLHVAARYSNIVAVRVLAELHPAALDANNSNGDTPLHVAARYSNSVAMFRELAELHPAALGAKNRKGDTPLHVAARYSNIVAMVRELVDLYPAALDAKNSNGDTPLHMAARYSNIVAMVRVLAELHPEALDANNSNGDTPLHVAARCSNSVAIVKELAHLHPAALSRTNASYSDTPLSAVASEIPSETLGKLQVLLDAAPQAARIANTKFYNCLPLHQLLYVDPPATPEMVAIVLTAYRDAVNIPDDDGWLPIHYAARYISVDVLKMIAEENMSHLSLVLPEIGSLAHSAVRGCSLDNLQYIHSKVPEVLMTVDSTNNNTPIHELLNDDGNGGGGLMKSLKNLRAPLSAASDILRYLLRHCPSLATAKNSDQQTLYDLLPAEDAGLAYARRLLLLAGASSLYPGALQELNYAARREALL